MIRLEGPGRRARPYVVDAGVHPSPSDTSHDASSGRRENSRPWGLKEDIRPLATQRDHTAGRAKRPIVTWTLRLVRDVVVGETRLDTERIEHADQHRLGVLLGLLLQFRLARCRDELLLRQLVQLL